MTKSNLTPKQIVDKNGKTTTVYVKDGPGAGAATGALTKGPSRAANRASGPKFIAELNDHVNEVMGGEAIEIKVRAKGNRTAIYRINSVGDKGGLFQSVDQAATTSMELSDGRKVYAYETGGFSERTSKDGVEYGSWTSPSDEDGNDISNRITYADIKALEKAEDDIPEVAFSGNSMATEPREQAEEIISEFMKMRDK